VAQRKQHQRARRGLAQSGADRQVVVGQVVDEQGLVRRCGSTDQPLASPEARGGRAALGVLARVVAGQAQPVVTVLQVHCTGDRLGMARQEGQRAAGHLVGLQRVAELLR
jgi:hypothetical protein